MLLTPSAAEVWKRALIEHPQYVGLLNSPRTRLWSFIEREECLWAGDNGAYGKHGFESDRFRHMLEMSDSSKNRCLFIVAPDVVGDAHATIAQFKQWGAELRDDGWPVAFVSQDRLNASVVPWNSFECFFVGGTDAWKLSQPSVALMHEAKERGKWLHIGRVNTRKRVLFCHHIGADSFDGTTFAIQPDGAAVWVLPLLRWLHVQPSLFEARIGGWDDDRPGVSPAYLHDAD